MTLVDSSAWIELIRGTQSSAHRRLRELLESGSVLATSDPIAMELLAGSRTAAGAERVHRTLAACRNLPVRREDWGEAAGVYLTCRRAGVPPRSMIDCIIAAVAIRTGTPVLASDEDFGRFAELTPLELA